MKISAASQSPPPMAVFRRGLPPFNPFARDAAFLARLRDCPPACPRRAAIHFLDPINPSNSPGIYRSASSFGKCTPKPDGLNSISSSCAGLACSRPCASCGEKLNVSFELSSTTTFPLARSYRAEMACGNSLRNCSPLLFANSMLLRDTMNLLPCFAKLAYMPIDQAFDCRQRSPLESIVLPQFARTHRTVEIEHCLAIWPDCVNVCWPVIGWINNDS
jgi:hypothetical protein